MSLVNILQCTTFGIRPRDVILHGSCVRAKKSEIRWDGCADYYLGVGCELKTLLSYDFDLGVKTRLELGLNPKP